MLTYLHCQIFNFSLCDIHHSWIFRNLSISFFHIPHQVLNVFVNSSLVIVFRFIAQIPGPLSMSSNFILVDTKLWSLNGKCFILVSNNLLHKPFEHKIKSIRDFDFPLWKEYRFLFGWSFLHASYKSYLVIRFCSSILPISSVRLLRYLSILLIFNFKLINWIRHFSFFKKLTCDRTPLPVDNTLKASIVFFCKHLI